MKTTALFHNEFPKIDILYQYISDFFDTLNVLKLLQMYYFFSFSLLYFTFIFYIVSCKLLVIGETDT